MSLVEEFQSKCTRYSIKNGQNNSDDGAPYLSLSRKADDEYPLYDNSDIADSLPKNNVRSPPPSKPMPLPKPTHLTTKPINSPQSPPNLTSKPTNLKLSTSSTEGRKPKPLPRPQTQLEKEADNALYGSTGDIYSATDNVVYAPVETGSQERPEYELPVDANNQTKSSKLGSSAQLFNVSDVHDQDENNQFALYVPVDGCNIMYKVPSNVEKFDPPKDGEDSSGEESYTDMTGDDYTDMQGDTYTDMQGDTYSDMQGGGDEYIDMQKQGDIPPNIDNELYTSMDGSIYVEPPCEHFVPPSTNKNDSSSEDEHTYDDVEEVTSYLRNKKGKGKSKNDSSHDEYVITV